LKICHHFTVDNLFHLKRGGRVSSVTAIVGTILKIKPVMHVSDEGKLVAIGKAMGRKKSLHTLVDNMFESMVGEEDGQIFISHGDCIEDVEYVTTLLKEKFPKTEIMVNYVGPVIGAHSGCGTVAIFNIGKHR
jgi:DegV family protein with EDD domain